MYRTRVLNDDNRMCSSINLTARPRARAPLPPAPPPGRASARPCRTRHPRRSPAPKLAIDSTGGLYIYVICVLLTYKRFGLELVRSSVCGFTSQSGTGKSAFVMRRSA